MSEELMLKLAKKLRARRLELGIRQDILAEEIGYARNLLCYWERGKKFPSRYGLEIWMEGLGVTSQITLREAKSARFEALLHKSNEQNFLKTERLRIAVPELMLRLREARKTRDVSLRELGVQIGISAVMLHYFETGKQVPTLRRLKQWGRALGVKIDMGPRGVPSPGPNTPRPTTILPAATSP